MAHKKLCSPEHTHYLGRVGGLPKNEFTDQMSAYFAQAMYHASPLQDLEDAVHEKTGANVAYLIPPRSHGSMYGAKEGGNNKRENQLVLGEATEHLAKIQSRVTVNIHYGL